MSGNQQPPVPPQPDDKKNLTWGEWMKTPAGMLTIAVIVLLIVGGGYYWYSQKSDGTGSEATPKLTSSGGRGRSRAGHSVRVARVHKGVY